MLDNAGLYTCCDPKVAPDGSLYIAQYRSYGANPFTGVYEGTYNTYILRSIDNGESWQLQGYIPYKYPDEEKDPLAHLKLGFVEPSLEFMPDGSMVWFFRSAWYGSTTWEWAPMYMSRSTDMGRTWSKPAVFAHTGILPRLCRLACGATLICYARPGIFIQGSCDKSGNVWSDPVVVMTPEDRSHLANIKIDTPTFHQWDGACNNPELLMLDDNSAMLFYSDFYYPDSAGVKRKSILCRKITVHLP